MPPMPPQELSDMIIDFLHNDVAALRSAGLVCKSWFPASRFHLFSDVNLYVCNLSYKLYSHGFLEAICAEGSTIPPYVVHLWIEDICQDAKKLDIALLRLPPFSNLKSLSLRQINWASLSSGAKNFVTTMAQNITTLTLFRCTFKTIDQAVALLASAPCLESLILWWNRCDDSMRNYTSKANAPPLRQIEIHLNPFTDAIMNWLCRCDSTPSVHTLKIDDKLTEFYIPTLSKFMRHLGSALENLTICCPSFESDVALSKQLDLSQNISLRNITFDCVLVDVDSRRPHSSACMISIISRIAHGNHRSLERVTMYIFLRNAEDINALELSALDTLFLSPPLSQNGTRPCFIIGGSVDMDVARFLLENTLPRLVGKGRLEVSQEI